MTDRPITVYWLIFLNVVFVFFISIFNEKMKGILDEFYEVSQFSRDFYACNVHGHAWDATPQSENTYQTD